MGPVAIKTAGLLTCLTASFIYAHAASVALIGTSMCDQNRTPETGRQGGAKSCLHDHTSSPVVRDVDKTLLRPSAAQRAGRPSPTEIFLGVTNLFYGTAGELLKMIGNFTDGNLWSELQVNTTIMYGLNTKGVKMGHSTSLWISVIIKRALS